MGTWRALLFLLCWIASTGYSDNSTSDNYGSSGNPGINSQRVGASERSVVIFHFNICSGKPTCNDDKNCSMSEFCDNPNEVFQRSCCKNRKPNGMLCSRDKECIGGWCPQGCCGECNDDHDCSTDKFCRYMYIPLSIKTCEKKLNDKQACNRNSMCISGKCIDFVCCSRCRSNTFLIGGQCKSDHECPSGQYCMTRKILIRPLRTGRRSKLRRACLIGQVCTESKPLGSLCSRNLECKTYICVAGRCSQCLSDGDCPIGKYCRIRNIPLFIRLCQPKKSRGFCSRPDQCQSGKCIFSRCKYS